MDAHRAEDGYIRDSKGNIVDQSRDPFVKEQMADLVTVEVPGLVLANMDDDQIDAQIKEAIAYSRSHNKIAFPAQVVQLRKDWVIRKMGQGFTKFQITQEMQARWGINKLYACKWYKEGLEELRNMSMESAAYVREVLQEKLESVAQKAMSEHMYREAVLAYAEINKMLGLYQTPEVKQINTTFNFGNLVDDGEQKSGV